MFSLALTVAYYLNVAAFSILLICSFSSSNRTRLAISCCCFNVGKSITISAISLGFTDGYVEVDVSPILLIIEKPYLKTKPNIDNKDQLYHD